MYVDIILRYYIKLAVSSYMDYLMKNIQKYINK